MDNNIINFKIKRVFILDLIFLLLILLSAFSILSIIVASIYYKEFFSIYGIVMLSSILATALSWFLNTKCYILNDVLHIRFMFTKKDIPLNTIKSIENVSHYGVASKMTKDGICIAYENKYSKNDVTISLVDEKTFIEYVEKYI